MNQFGDPEDVLYGLSSVLGDSARFGPVHRLEAQVLDTLDRLNPYEAESFTSALSSIGNFAKSSGVRDFASAALPIVGAGVGTVVGGPAGTAIGASVGGMAGQAIASKPHAAPSYQPPPSYQPAPVAQPVAAYQPTPTALDVPQVAASAATIPAVMPAQPTVAGGGGSAAAAQLLGVIQDPALISSLLSLVLGTNGRSAIPLKGGGEIPVGALTNLVSVLAGKASEDAEDILMARQDAVPSYLLDDHGCLTCDPANPRDRADALLRVLRSQRQSGAQDQSCSRSGNSDGEDVDSWLR